MPSNQKQAPISQHPAADIELRSEEVQEILTRVPHWMIRWGNSIILTLFVLFMVLAYYIKYPDIIKAEVVITTQIPPEKLVAKTSGKIQKIGVGNQQVVAANTVIAIIENTANFEEVFLLKSIIDTIKQDSIFYFPVENFTFSQLGTVENAFANFKNNYTAYRQYIELQPHQIEIKAQNKETYQQSNRIV